MVGRRYILVASRRVIVFSLSEKRKEREKGGKGRIRDRLIRGKR